jgi:Bacterial Ig-like domain/RTX calcium-binding nonapeptide repeat (4 copies)
VTAYVLSNVNASQGSVTATAAALPDGAPPGALSSTSVPAYTTGTITVQAPAGESVSGVDLGSDIQLTGTQNADGSWTLTPDQPLPVGQDQIAVVFTSQTPDTSQDVFVGGITGFDDLANPANTALLTATGRVGMEMQEEGVAPAYYAGQLPGIVAAMAGTGPGIAEINLVPQSNAANWWADYFSPIYADNNMDPDAFNVMADFFNPAAFTQFGYSDPGGWLQDFETFMNDGRAYGVQTFAPMFAPNYAPSITPWTNFATDPTYQSIREAALLGGGLCIDAPPGFFFQSGPQYQQFVEGMVEWANANHLRTTWLLTPFPAYTPDTAAEATANFLPQTQQMIAQLVAAGAVPSQWVVEDYSGENIDPVGSDTTANTVANVALWVAQNAPTTPWSVSNASILNLQVSQPPAPSVTVDGLVDGTPQADGATTDPTPTLYGTGSPDDPVTLADGSTVIGTTSTDSSGNWSFTPASSLAVGAHTITASVTQYGVSASAAFSLTIGPAVTAPANEPFGTAASSAISGLLGTASGGAADVVFLQPGQTFDTNSLPSGAVSALDVDDASVGQTVTVPSTDPLIQNSADGPVTIQGGSQSAVIVSTGTNLTYLTGGADGVFLGEAGASGNYGQNTVITPAQGSGHFIIEAGGGKNVIVAASGDNSISGGTGANLITLGTGSNVVASGGTDTIVGGSGAATITAGAGGVANSALVFMNGGAMTFINGGGASTLTGGAGSATVNAGAGGGAYWGGTAGHNVMTAGTGAATLFGGGSGDDLAAGAGRGDALLVAAASSGNATLTAAGSKGDNVMFTRRTNALVTGGGGADTIVGGTGHSTVHAGAGQDLIFTGKAGDVVYGGKGTSTVASSTAAATVHGGRGDMTIWNFAQGSEFLAGKGNASIAGGGTSVFDIVNGQAGGALTVWNFDPSQDHIALSGYSSGAAADALASQQNASGSTTLTLSDGTSLVLIGVSSVTSNVFA